MSNNILMIKFSRTFCSCSFPMMNKFVNREGKFMNKLISSSNTRKRKFYINEGVVGSPFKVTETAKSNKENNRRTAVLNSLFMKSISEILMTSYISEDILGKGLEISRVSVNQHFNQVNVFWVSSKEENMIELEKLLPNLGFKLRHELTQLGAMGVVPRIVFVKDKKYYSTLQVEQLLSIADYGEDYEPLSPSSTFKEGLPGQTSISSSKMEKNSTEEKGTTLEEKLNKIEEEEEEKLPEMTHDVFGLDHKLIMEKVLKKMNKARAKHRFQPNLEIESDGINKKLVACSNSAEKTMTSEERKEAISKFLLQRKIQQRKLKADRSGKDKSLYLELNHDETHDSDDSVDGLHTEDYIDDDFYEEDRRFQN